MKKTQHILSFLLIPAFLLGSFAVIPQAGATKPTPNASFSIKSVTPSEFSPSQSTSIDIVGTSFTSGLAVGIAKEGNVITSITGLTVLTSAFVGATSMTATVPSGLVAGEYDLYVYDPNQSTFTFAKKEEALECEVKVDDDGLTVAHSHSNAARRKVDVTFDGLVTKKRWVKVRMAGKNVPILKLIKNDGNTTTLRLNVKYKNLAPGTYDLTMTYRNKNRVISGQTKKGRNKYRNEWQRGTATVSGFLVVVAPTP